MPRRLLYLVLPAVLFGCAGPRGVPPQLMAALPAEPLTPDRLERELVPERPASFSALLPEGQDLMKTLGFMGAFIAGMDAKAGEMGKGLMELSVIERNPSFPVTDAARTFRILKAYRFLDSMFGMYGEMMRLGNMGGFWQSMLASAKDEEARAFLQKLMRDAPERTSGLAAWWAVQMLRVAETDEQRTEALTILADRAAKRERFELAAQLSTLRVERSPTIEAQDWVELARAWSRALRPEPARIAWEKARDVEPPAEPEKLDATLRLVEAAATAAAADPARPESLARRAVALFDLERDADAQREVDRILRTDPDQPLALSLQARLALREGRYAAADELFRRTAARKGLQPDHVDLWAQALVYAQFSSSLGQEEGGSFASRATDNVNAIRHMAGALTASNPTRARLFSLYAEGLEDLTRNMRAGGSNLPVGLLPDLFHRALRIRAMDPESIETQYLLAVAIPFAPSADMGLPAWMAQLPEGPATNPRVQFARVRSALVSRYDLAPSPVRERLEEMLAGLPSGTTWATDAALARGDYHALRASTHRSLSAWGQARDAYQEGIRAVEEDKVPDVLRHNHRVALFHLGDYASIPRREPKADEKPGLKDALADLLWVAARARLATAPEDACTTALTWARNADLDRGIRFQFYAWCAEALRAGGRHQALADLYGELERDMFTQLASPVEWGATGISDIWSTTFNLDWKERRSSTKGNHTSTTVVAGPSAAQWFYPVSSVTPETVRFLRGGD